MKAKNINEILKIDIDNKKVKKVTLYALSFFIPFIALLIVIMTLKVYPFGENTYLPVDAFSQYTPYMDYLKDVFSGNNSIFYSLGKSLGGEMYGLFTYYLISPFNLLVILFSKEQMATAFYLILMLKTATAGTTFYVFLNRKEEPKISNLIFSSMYALSVVAITYGFNIMWLDSFILLPILCIGIENIVKYKNPILYTMILALILITNYYMGFMICIFACMYFVYQLIINNLKPVKETLRKIGKFALFSILAAVISAVILIPSFIGIKEGRVKEDDEENEGFKTNFEIQNVVSKFFTNAFTLEEIGNEAMPPIFCGALANFLILMYFTNKKIKLREKIATLIIFAIFFASFYIEKLHLLWMLGNPPAFYRYRYIYGFTFMYVMIAAKSFENIKTGTKSWKMLIAVLISEIAGVYTLHLDLELTDKLFVQINMILAFVFYIMLEIYRLDLSKTKLNEKMKKYGNIGAVAILLLITTVDLTINAHTCMKELKEKTSSNDIEGQVFLTEYNDYKYKEIKNTDKGIYRSETVGRITENDSLAFGYNGVSFSASTFSRKLHDFLRDLGYSEEHVTVSANGGNTKAIDMLFGIKYIVGEKNTRIKEEYQEEMIGLVKLDKNPYTISLGFSVPETAILETVEMNREKSFENQSKILKKLTNLNDEIFEKHQGKITKTLQNLEENSENAENYKKINPEEEAIVKYEFEIERPEEAYFYIPFATELKTVEIYVNGEKLSRRYGGSYNRMILLGKRDIGEKIEIEINQEKEVFLLNKECVYYENSDILKKYYDVLSKEQVDLKQISRTKYEGRIKIQSDNEYVFFTIPYDEGWKIKVDRKRG